MSHKSPPDVEAATASRMESIRRDLVADIALMLANYGFAQVPQSIIDRINRALWQAEREGEHHAGLRRTVRRTPVDVDRVPSRLDDEDRTPVYGVKDHKKGRR